MSEMDNLKKMLQAEADLELAVLIGSRASGTATQHSDWDIAIHWEKHIDGLARIEYSEVLRRKIADAITVHQDQIDLIDIPTAWLAMRAVIAEEVLN